MSYELSDDEKSRIIHNKDYKLHKMMHKSYLRYSKLEVGEVYLLKRGKSYVCHYGKSPTKFYVVHKDEGFVFAKRISGSGKLGKEVICLTTSYPVTDSTVYELEPDETYIESIILGIKYDPTSEGKGLTNRKNRARSHNNKLIIKNHKVENAMAFLKTLNKGDKLWDCGAKYGGGIVEWTVSGIVKRPACQTYVKPSYSWQPPHKHRGSTSEDRDHNEAGFSDVIILELTPKLITTGYRRYVNTKYITFKDFLDNNRWMSKKPKSPEDFL